MSAILRYIAIFSHDPQRHVLNKVLILLGICFHLHLEWFLLVTIGADHFVVGVRYGCDNFKNGRRDYA